MTLQRKTSLRTKSPLRKKSWLKSKPKSKLAESKFEASEVKVKKPVENKKKHTDELDKVFSFYIRLRDSMPGGMCKCISCGKIVPFSKIQAGHYRSRGNMSTRWNPDNVNGECVECNLQLRNGDHLLDYRANLIRKIGENKVTWIDAYSREPYKYTDFELTILIKDYTKKCLTLSNQKGIPLSKEVQRIIKKYSV